MILPGLIAAAYYRRRPSTLQIALGIVFTVVVSALLGYIQDMGTSRVWVNVVEAVVGGLILYAAVLAYLLYRYFPAQARLAEAAGTSNSPPAS